jgi:hypothetical protein
MKIPYRNFINVFSIFFTVTLAGCASDDSFSSHLSLKDRIKDSGTIDVFFVDFQPTRISVVEKCEGGLKNCIIGGVLEQSILSAMNASDVISEQKSRFSLKIKNAFDRSLLKEHFFSLLSSEVNKCGIRLNIRPSLVVKNEAIGSVSGNTSLKWILGGDESSKHARSIIIPKISNTDSRHSMILLVAVAEITLYLGAEDAIHPKLSYKFYDKKIDTITGLMGTAFASKDKEIRILRDIGSQPKIEEELKKSVGWAAKRLAYDMCGGISSDNPNVRLLGDELRR